MVLQAVDLRLVTRLLREPNVEEGATTRQTFMRFLQEGVVLRADPFDDKLNYTGTLMLVGEVPTMDETAEQTVHRASSYLLWVPHSLLLRIAPHQVSPAARAVFEAKAKVAGTTAAAVSPEETTPSTTLLDPASLRVEDMYTICIPVTGLRKMLRRTNLRGKRIVILTRHNGDQECPLIFNEGGMTKLVDELKKANLLRQNPSVAEELLFPPPTTSPPPQPRGEGEEAENVEINGQLAAVVAGGVMSGGGGPQHADPSVATTTSKGMSPVEEQQAHRDQLYGGGSQDSNGKIDKTKKALGKMLNFGQKVHDRTAKIVEGVVGSSAINGGGVYDGINEREDSNGSGGSFDVVVPLEDIENLIPVLTHLSKEKKMGPFLTETDWLECFDGEGRMVAEYFARARLKVFNGGIEECRVHRVGGGDASDPTYSLRGEVWSYLLEVYYPSQSYLEKEAARAEWCREYSAYKLQWMSVTSAQAKMWAGFRDHKVSIEKDVSRTDRTHPAFAEEDSPKLLQLNDILMSYAMYNYDLGYCQGMSDMCAMILLLFDDEVEAFVMFRAMIGKKCPGNFGADVLKGGMAHSLKAINTLCASFVPTLHAHLEKNFATDFSFVFRWLLLLFKREFPIPQVFTLWDALLSSPYTEQYELFVTVAILRNLTGQILEQALTYDEMLKFTCNVAMRLDVTDVLLLTAEFYEFVTQQMAWKKRSVVGIEGNGLAKPSLQDILTTMAPPSEAQSPSSPKGGGGF